MKNVLYYHLYLTEDYGTWSHIFLEQMKLLEDTRALDILDEIKYTVVCNNEERMKAFVSLQEHFSKGKRVEIEMVLNPHENDHVMLSELENSNTITENHTMRKIWKASQNDNMYVLYLHSKGITSTERFLKAGDSQTFLKYYYWRQYLNWGVIENWTECYSALKYGDYDIAGVNYYDNPSRHFSGNFWWANSNYIKTLPDPSNTKWWEELKSKSTDSWLRTASDRFRDEQWPCSLDSVKVYNIYSPNQENNPASRLTPRVLYGE